MQFGNQEIITRESMPSYGAADQPEHLFQAYQDVLARRLQTMQPMNTQVQAANVGSQEASPNQWD